MKWFDNFPQTFKPTELSELKIQELFSLNLKMPMYGLMVTNLNLFSILQSSLVKLSICILWELLSVEKKRPQLKKKKENYKVKKLTSKGKHSTKAGNHPHMNMTSKTAIMRGGKRECRILERHLKWRDQPLLFLNFKYQGLKMKAIKLLEKETKRWL